MILVRSFRGKDKGSCSEIRNRKKKYGGLSDGRKDLYERRIQENEILEVTFVGEE